MEAVSPLPPPPPPPLPFSLSLSSSHREHASRSTKGMQLLILPLYGGLPYTEQVCFWPWTTTLFPGSHAWVVPGNEAGTTRRISFHILTCVSVEGVSQDPTKHKKGEEFFCLLVVFWYYLFVCLFVCLFVVCLFVCLSVCLFVCLFAQVVVATNIAETSVTINGIVYGVCTSRPMNHFFTTLFLLLQFLLFPPSSLFALLSSLLPQSISLSPVPRLATSFPLSLVTSVSTILLSLLCSYRLWLCEVKSLLPKNFFR